MSHLSITGKKIIIEKKNKHKSPGNFNEVFIVAGVTKVGA